MPEPTYSIRGKNIEELRREVQQLFDDLYRERLGGAIVGDVFGLNNQDDSLQLNLAQKSGLTKTKSVLAVLAKPAGPVTVDTTGVDVSLASTIKKGAVPTLPNNALQYFDGTGAWSIPPSTAAFPVGSVFIAVVATNPNILLGYGTWQLLGYGHLTLS